MKTILAAAALLLTVSAPIAQASTTKLFAFGDSLLDSGNLEASLQFTTGTGINDIPPLPGTPPREYFQGQFSNGNVWTTQLGLTPSLLGGTNFGFGGAKAVADDDGIPDLKLQIKDFLSRNLPTGADTAAAIQVGGNDFRAIALDPTLSADAVSKEIRRMTRTIAKSVKKLNRAGIARVLVIGLPVTPALPASVTEFNDRLIKLSDRLDHRLHADVDYFDTNSFFQGLIFQTSQQREITLVPCIYDPVGCAADPDKYVFFDEIHPSAWVHTAFADAIRQELAQPVSEVPLPASLPLLVAGLAGTGLMLRRRKSRA